MLYKDICTSKDNLSIPVFNDGKTMHSKYAPLKEASSFGLDINDGSEYTIILGIGGGYHIHDFHSRHPEHFIIAVEESCDELNFLSSIDSFNELKNIPNIEIITRDQLKQTLLSTYLPALYGGINILKQRAWCEQNTSEMQNIIDTINLTLKEISKDYSVQCHFGLMWQKNIINNLRHLSKSGTNKIEVKTAKTAAIIAAGPSLDYSLTELIQNRNNYYIIATDTAYSVLKKNNIKCDTVISIDGQNISYKHFIGTIDQDTNYIFDLQANFNAVNHVAKYTDNIFFFKSGHPFCTYAEQLSGFTFPEITSGAGTVTIAAIDFARKSGFSDFAVFGADFSYILNKPYTKGTYLDALYRGPENRLLNSENDFSKLMFRTETLKSQTVINSIKTTKLVTEVLDSYKETFLQWIKANNMNYKYENYIYKIKPIELKSHNHLPENVSNFNFDLFLSKLKNEVSITDCSSLDALTKSNLIISLLPFIAYLRNRYKTGSYIESLKLALTKILEYT